MQIQKTDIPVTASAFEKAPGAVSSRFSKIFDSNLAQTEKDNGDSRLSTKAAAELEKEKGCKWVNLGVISSSHPTVSHLLIEHPEYGKNCWKIIHSDLNRDKPYKRIPPGIHIYLDPETREIIWDYAESGPHYILSEGASSQTWRKTPPGNTEPCSVQKQQCSNPKLPNESVVSLRGHGENKTSERERINLSVSAAAAKYGLSSRLIKSVIKAESDYQVQATSPAGARGLMQLMPATAQELGVKDPFDVMENIDGGTKYLKKMLDTFSGDLVKALAAYNAGPETIKNHQGRIPYPETRLYVQRVLSFLQEYE